MTASAVGSALFAEINNAILDLQSSELQTFGRCFSRLSRLLNSEGIGEVSARLKSAVDLAEFIKASEATGGSMAGSHKLLWPDKREHEFGLTLALIDHLAADEREAIGFCHAFFYTGRKPIGDIRAFTSQILIPFARDYRSYVERTVGLVREREIDMSSGRIFIVHGHDEAARETVARFLERLDLVPIILREQPNLGLTIPEKLVKYSDVGFAVVLMTPDDEGRSVKDAALKLRARQNVVLELGFFIGLLGRERVCALKRGDVEIPSDYLNVAYTALDEAGAWKTLLGRELVTAGYSIDWNRMMR
jgi:hypothetical protein